MIRNRKTRRQRICSIWLAGIILSLLPFVLTGALLWLLLPLVVLGVGHRWMFQPGGVAVLTYHSVVPNADWLPWGAEISVTPEILDAQLAMLRKGGCTFISTRQFLEARAEGQHLPDRAVILHFDDGYYDNYLHAAPILRQHAAPATFFASTRFIEPSPRSYFEEDGYMTAEELQEIDADPLFEVHPHGTDHGRVPISDKAIDTLSEQNWRFHAWMTWAARAGSLHDWARRDAPAVPLGSPVPQSKPALSSAALGETDAAFKARVRQTLGEARDILKSLVPNSQADIFCWPQNKTVPSSRQIADELGYICTTGGQGENRADEPAEILSRVHMGDRNFGIRSIRLDGLMALATARAFHGNFYWTFPIVLASTIKKFVKAARKHKAA